jgi:hypothetical protein
MGMPTPTFAFFKNLTIVFRKLEIRWEWQKESSLGNRQELPFPRAGKEEIFSKGRGWKGPIGFNRGRTAEEGEIG